MIGWEDTGNTGREQEFKYSRQQLGQRKENSSGTARVIMQMTQNFQYKHLWYIDYLPGLEISGNKCPHFRFGFTDCVTQIQHVLFPQ